GLHGARPEITPKPSLIAKKYKPVGRRKSMQPADYSQIVTLYLNTHCSQFVARSRDSIDNHWHEIFVLAASHPASPTAGKRIFIRFRDPGLLYKYCALSTGALQPIG